MSETEILELACDAVRAACSTGLQPLTEKELHFRSMIRLAEDPEIGRRLLFRQDAVNKAGAIARLKRGVSAAIAIRRLATSVRL